MQLCHNAKSLGFGAWFYDLPIISITPTLLLWFSLLQENLWNFDGNLSTLQCASEKALRMKLRVKQWKNILLQLIKSWQPGPWINRSDKASLAFLFAAGVLSPWGLSSKRSNSSFVCDWLAKILEKIFQDFGDQPVPTMIKSSPGLRYVRKIFTIIAVKCSNRATLSHIHYVIGYIHNEY